VFAVFRVQMFRVQTQGSVMHVESPWPPHLCNPKAWAQSSKLTCCSPDRVPSSSQPLMCRLRYLTCHKGRTSILLGKLTQNPPAIESVAFLSHHENHMGCVMYRGRHSCCCQCFLLSPL
jgi:hypothetical protein